MPARVQRSPTLRHAFAQHGKAAGAIRARVASRECASTRCWPRRAAPDPGCSTRPSARARARARPANRWPRRLSPAAARHVSASRKHCATNSRTKVSPMPSEPSSSSTPGSKSSSDTGSSMRGLVACTFAWPLMATSASVSSRRAATTGLVRNARAPACSHCWIASGVTSALSTMTGVCLPPPASITRNCAQQVQAADAGHVQVDDRRVEGVGRQAHRALPRRRRRWSRGGRPSAAGAAAPCGWRRGRRRSAGAAGARARDGAGRDRRRR